MIVFSQGLNPNVDMLKDKINPSKSVWITTVTSEHPKADRRERREKWENSGAKFITYEV